MFKLTNEKGDYIVYSGEHFIDISVGHGQDFSFSYKISSDEIVQEAVP